jgi:putative restriction endonuclease
LPILNRKQLNAKLVEAVQSCGWNVLYSSSLDALPFLIRIYGDDESNSLRIYIWNLSHGGKTRSADEYRIQVKVDRFQQTAGETTLVLGWSDDIEVFGGFDVRKHSGRLGYSSSIQISLETLRKASLNGVSAHDKGNGEIAVGFRPEFFVDYVRNLEALHDFGQSARDLRVLETVIEQVADEKNILNEEDLVHASRRRKSVIRTITQKVRDVSFARRVLTAYGYQCVFCSLQLKLVDAAHILPVAEITSTDYTSNGLAACPLHHRAYDNALITIDASYQTLVNKKRIEHLTDIHYDGGMKQFTQNLRPVIHVPPAVKDRPHKDFIERANKLRGWNKAVSATPASL